MPLSSETLVCNYLHMNMSWTWLHFNRVAHDVKFFGLLVDIKVDQIISHKGNNCLFFINLPFFATFNMDLPLFHMWNYPASHTHICFFYKSFYFCNINNTYEYMNSINVYNTPTHYQLKLFLARNRVRGILFEAILTIS